MVFLIPVFCFGIQLDYSLLNIPPLHFHHLLNFFPMEDNRTHFLKISGTVPSGKRREFEQTFKFVANHLGPNCLQHALSADIFLLDRYYFYSLWRSSESLEDFFKSQEFVVLEGAFKTLGVLEKRMSGELAEIISFQEQG